MALQAMTYATPKKNEYAMKGCQIRLSQRLTVLVSCSRVGLRIGIERIVARKIQVYI
jgi:hypothetical protein